MICYLDTSACVPLLVEEPSTTICRRLWDQADDVVTSQLLYVEAAAALAQAMRSTRVTERQRRGALRVLDRLCDELAVVRIDEPLTRRAADLAHQYALRGYDAVHCAAAESVHADDLVVASGDRRLLGACSGLGLATADVNAR
jgi:predicted nucleic acid-binding protein